MSKRKAIVEKGIESFCVAIVALVVGVLIASASYKERLQERQQYAQNAYNLGIAEYLGLAKMSPEDGAEFQKKIQEIVNAQLSLQEQEKAMVEIYTILQEYSDTNIILPKESQ